MKDIATQARELEAKLFAAGQSTAARIAVLEEAIHGGQIPGPAASKVAETSDHAAGSVELHDHDAATPSTVARIGLDGRARPATAEEIASLGGRAVFVVDRDTEALARGELSGTITIGGDDRRDANPDAGDPMGRTVIGPEGPRVERGRNDAKPVPEGRCPNCWDAARGLSIGCRLCEETGKRRFDAKQDGDLRCEECNAKGGPDGVLLSQFITSDRWRCYDQSACFRRQTSPIGADRSKATPPKDRAWTPDEQRSVYGSKATPEPGSVEEKLIASWNHDPDTFQGILAADALALYRAERAALRSERDALRESRRQLADEYEASLRGRPEASPRSLCEEECALRPGHPFWCRDKEGRACAAQATDPAEIALGIAEAMGYATNDPLNDVIDARNLAILTKAVEKIQRETAERARRSAQRVHDKTFALMKLIGETEKARIPRAVFDAWSELEDVWADRESAQHGGGK